jgi:hypothetical protein
LLVPRMLTARQGRLTKDRDDLATALNTVTAESARWREERDRLAAEFQRCARENSVLREQIEEQKDIIEDFMEADRIRELHPTHHCKPPLGSPTRDEAIAALMTIGVLARDYGPFASIATGLSLKEQIAEVIAITVSPSDRAASRPTREEAIAALREIDAKAGAFLGRGWPSSHDGLLRADEEFRNIVAIISAVLPKEGREP